MSKQKKSGMKRIGLLLTMVMVFSMITVPTMQAVAADSGWISANGYNDNTNTGTPDKAYVSDDEYANFDFHADSVHYTFGNNIVPSTAIIQGIEVRLEARESLVGGRSFEVTLLDSGTERGNKPTGDLSNDDKIYTLGNSSDTWGYTGWTGDKINNHFEVKVRSKWGTFNAYLDHIELRVTYTLPTTTTTVTSSSSTSTYGDTVTFTATVTPGTPDGNVEFFVDDTSVGTSGLSGGTATKDIPGLFAGTHTIKAVYGGSALYQGSFGSCTQTVNKANATIVVNGTTVTYDGNAHGATGTATGADGSNLSSLLNLGSTFTNVPGGTANWSFPGDSNHNPASGSVVIVINKAEADIDVDGATVAYDGNSHGATGTATGADGSDLSSLLHLGATYTNVPGGPANWTFDGDANHNSDSGSVEITINKADATIDVDGVTVKYDGSPHGATGSATGADGSDLTSLLHLGATYTNVPGGTADWTFDGNDNHNSANGSVDIIITQADSTTTVESDNNPSTYGDSVTFTATVTPSVATGDVEFYVDGSSIGSAAVSSGTATFSTSSISADDHTIKAEYKGNTTYAGSEGTCDQKVNKADATINVQGVIVAYDGNPHGATGSVTGADGSDLSSLLDLGETYTNVSGGTAHWSFAGDANHNSASGSVEIVINKADATIDVDGVTVKYDGNPHGATGSATGADGSDLTSLLDLGATFTDVPGGTANWTFAGNDNHKSASGSVDIIINKADTTTTVASDNNPSTYGEFITFTATVTPAIATGTVQFYVDGSELLTPALVTSGTAILATSTLPAGNHTIKAVYSGAANYSGSEGTLAQTVDKADATIDVQGVTVTYDGTSHGAIGTATGADGSDLSSLLNLGSSYTDVPGGKADWSFPGDANHNPANGSVDIVINKAMLTVKADSKYIPYAHSKPSYTESYSGFKGGDDETVLSGEPSLTCTYDRGDDAGSYTIKISKNTLDAANYDLTFVNGTLHVRKASLTVTADNKSVTYGSPAPAYTASFSGFVNGDDKSDLSGTLAFDCSYTAGSPVSGSPYSITPRGLSSNNYTISYGAGQLTVNAAARTTTGATVTPSPTLTPAPSVSPSPSPTPAPEESATPPADTGNNDTETIGENDVPAGTANAKGTGFFSHWWSWMILALGLLLLLLILLLILNRRKKEQEQH